MAGPVRSRRFGCHLVEERLVVVDVVDADDDLGGAAERVRAARRVVVSGGDVENVLRSPKPGGGAPSQLDDACTRTHTHTEFKITFYISSFLSLFLNK